ncbi:MAG: pyridoxal phosphate-dependent aminotransferase [Patescibacteria group bacterium]
MLAKRILQLEPSATVAVDVRAKALKQKGIPIINAGVGEPDFPTPQNIKDAAIKAINDNFTYYTAPEGILPLREVIAKKLATDNHIDYTPSQIVVGPSSKEVLYNAFQVLINPGDEVLIATPTWTTFSEQVKLAGGIPVFISLRPPFKLTAADVAQAITKRTKALLLNTPSNPTGAMIDRDELEKIAELAVKHDFWILSDEIYEKIVHTAPHTSIASLGGDIKARTITSNGFSKTYSMTGWRIGYAAGPQEIMNGMKALQSQMVSCTSSIAQMAGIEALNGNQDEPQRYVEEFTKRRNMLFPLLQAIPGLGVTPAEGAFYAFISIEKVLNKKYPTSIAWCEALLEQEKVAVVPGEAFLAPGYVRMSFAASEADLREAVTRIKRFVL